MDPVKRPIRYSDFVTGLVKKNWCVPCSKSRRMELATKAVITKSPIRENSVSCSTITSGALRATVLGALLNTTLASVDARSTASSAKVRAAR